MKKDIQNPNLPHCRRLVAVMNQQCKPASANLSRNGTEAGGQDNADEPGLSVGKDADKDDKGGKKGNNIVSFIEVEPASLTTTASSDLNKAVNTKEPTSNATISKVENKTNQPELSTSSNSKSCKNDPTDAKTKNTDQKSENMATGKNLKNLNITDVADVAHEEKDKVKCDTADSSIATTNINSNIVTKSAKRTKGTICVK